MNLPSYIHIWAIIEPMCMYDLRRVLYISCTVGMFCFCFLSTEFVNIKIYAFAHDVDSTLTKCIYRCSDTAKGMSDPIPCHKDSSTSLFLCLFFFSHSISSYVLFFLTRLHEKFWLFLTCQMVSPFRLMCYDENDKWFRYGFLHIFFLFFLFYAWFWNRQTR